MFSKRVHGNVGLPARLQVRKTLEEVRVNKSNINEHTHSGEHGHVNGIRVVHIDSICMSKRDFFWGMSFVKAVLRSGSRVISVTLLLTCATLT